MPEQTLCLVIGIILIGLSLPAFLLEMAWRKMRAMERGADALERISKK